LIFFYSSFFHISIFRNEKKTNKKIKTKIK